MAVNGSGGASDLANDDLDDYADHSAAKKTDMPRSSINKQWERQKGQLGRICKKKMKRRTFTYCTFLFIRKKRLYNILVQIALSCSQLVKSLWGIVGCKPSSGVDLEV